MRFPLKNTRLGSITLFSFLTVFFLLSITYTAQAQYSNLGFSFQGYAIDGEGKALASTGVTVRFTVYRTGVSYVEEHTLTSDTYGVFVANVGKGTPSGSVTFGSLDFNNFDFSLKVEVRETVGGTYATISDKALQAVPYARSASNGVPVGTVIAYAGPTTTIPTGWLLCDGTTLNASTNTQYAQLYAAIGTNWGGTGVTSFNVPDLRGLFLRGVNGTRSDGYADANTSRALGSLQASQTKLPNSAFNVYTVSVGNHTHGYTNPQIGGINIQPSGDAGGARTKEYPTTDGGTTTGAGAHNHSLDTGTWSGGDSETTPKNAAVYYIIKY